MQFKHPELLYALLLLLIPIIIHLFQLRRFQKEAFTNVQFLKKVTLQTRKSSQLKKWVTLLTRLLLLAAVILAFAQPYTSKLKNLKTKTERVIYLDNSFSMQAKGEKGMLLKRAIQEIIDALNKNDKITIFTNNSTLKNASKKTITEELLRLEFSSNQLDYNTVVLKGKQLFSKESTSIKHLVLVSDFQKQQKNLVVPPDSLLNISLVQLLPVKTSNINIDSVYISKSNLNSIELTVLIKLEDDVTSDISISLYNNEKLIAKTAINALNGLKGTFTLPSNTEINGKIVVEDNSLQFDNVLYFNINKKSKINVLSINSVTDNYLKRVYSDDEFNYQSVAFKNLNYRLIEQQNLIILNELKSIPQSLSNALNLFTSQGGDVLIIPSEEIDLTSYNQLLANNKLTFEFLNTNEKKITTINYEHPILHGVFDKKVSNFQYPKVNSFHNIISTQSPILKFEDGKAFLVQNKNVFVFSSALNSNNSNFTSSPLIVPVLYNIGRHSLQLPKLYYTIGKENNFDVKTTMQQDDILKLKLNISEIIPQQRTYSTKVALTTHENPEIAGVYTVENKSEILEHISYNYNRNESIMSYLNTNNIKNVDVKSSIPQFFKDIKTASNVNELWKWFVIFAFVLLILEMLILKYFK